MVNELKFKKRVLIILETDNKYMNIAKKLIRIFYPIEVVLVFYLENKKFHASGQMYDNINDFIFKEDVVINMLDISKDTFSRDIEKKINFLNKNIFFESTDKKILFSSKNNIKLFLKNNDIKTPVFNIINSADYKKIYTSFIQPSRIFSKENDYYSEKIDSVEKIKNIFENIIGEKKSNYIIEEYIEGQNIYSFVSKDGNNLKVYNIEKKIEEGKSIYKILSSELNNLVKNNSVKFFKDFGFEKFILIHYKFNEKRGLYFLNAFVDHKLLFDQNYSIINNIFEKEGLNFSLFLKNHLN